MVKEDLSELLETPSGDKWKSIGARKRAGLLVPLFSVYSNKSTGIGDFADLNLLVDLCHSTGNSILQLLPMNEVGATFCPYDAISSFAIEPMYISLEDMAASAKKHLKDKIRTLKKKFPAGAGHVDYRIKEEKVLALMDIFIEEDFYRSKEFKKFIIENEYWINDFALFKAIKNNQGGRPWYEWDDGYRDRDEVSLEIFEKKHEKEILFQKWVQWIAFEQFTAAQRYAESKNVFIKGDLPILISRDSADVWAHRGFFKLDFAAGAPPDMYCAKGQRWGVPIYDWDAISADGHTYLKEKLKYAQNFYDMLRIDHVVGLFRIWSIPYNEPSINEGLNGFFDPSDENTWEEHGKDILSIMLGNSDMLFCAEDLGMIPKVCPKTLKEFGIPGNDVQRWVKDWSVLHDFLLPKDYRFPAIAMLSTHDTTNWAAWWENEAGTVDEALFVRKCADRGIDYKSVKAKLFNPDMSRRGRLRWLDNISSTDDFVEILGKRKEELMDFIDMYENTYKEKDKLWKQLGIKGRMREKCDHNILRAALKLTLSSRAVFCIELLLDCLKITDILKGDPYQYRINKPGTVSKDNWSLVIPMALDDLLRHKVCKDLKAMISASGRI